MLGNKFKAHDYYARHGPAMGFPTDILVPSLTGNLSKEITSEDLNSSYNQHYSTNINQRKKSAIFTVVEKREDLKNALESSKLVITYVFKPYNCLQCKLERDYIQETYAENTLIEFYLLSSTFGQAVLKQE